MIQVSVVNCPHCTNGKKITNKCGVCNGNCTIQEESTFSLNINKGTVDGTTAIINDAGDFNIETKQYSDIMFIIKESDHPRLKRQGDDLVLNHTISLYEALCGFSFKYVHLDDKTYHIICSSGSDPSKKYSINGMGMPCENGYGQLIINIHIHYDNSEFSIQEKTQLKRILKFDRTDLETFKEEIELKM
jgi:DnaJ-class molecular chaperone